ncbi:MAG: peptide-methionine (S)-S-oxide reductase MsrA [Pseudomonadales bacterium]
MFHKVTELLPDQACLPGRQGQMIVSGKHLVLGSYYVEPFPSSTRSVLFGMGCFWGAERLFWALPGVYTTGVGYAGGLTSNPSYEEVCSGYTNHTESVLVVYQPEEITLQNLLTTFWQEHDPTQGMRQGNDVGTQYRSAIYVDTDEDLNLVRESRDQYQQMLLSAGKGEITTEIRNNQKFYYAEDYHQQYLHKNPNGYCGLAGCGVRFKPESE